MHVESKRSGHWTDDQLIAYLYGISPDDHHLSNCRECQLRVSQFQERQQKLGFEDVDLQLLASQRRRIYARLTASTHWYARWQVRRWASVAAIAVVLGGGALFYEEHEQQHVVSSRLSDAQLAQDVSLLAQNSEDSPTGPLEALFDE
jgi:hypothetical protein